MINITQTEKSKRIKYLFILIGLISLASLIMMLPSFIDGNYFIGGGDVKTQWFPFYVLNQKTTETALNDHTLPFYSFILFLGNNIWASKTSYGLFDIYNLISYAFPCNYFVTYDILAFVKLLVSGITFYLLIDYIYGNSKVSLIAGICYALSSYSIYFTSQPGFLSFFSLMPLYFLGIEKYLKENKKYLFIISVFLLLLVNYYFFYAVSLFSPIYFIYRYYVINRNNKGLIKSALILIVYYLIGVLLSGVIIVPTFLYIIQNERLGSVSSSLTIGDIKVYLHLLIAQFVPSHAYIYSNNVFDNGAHTLKEICLYSGTISSILVPQFISDKDKKYKKATLYLYITLLLLLFIPFLSSLMNGLGGVCYRWLLLFIMVNIIVSSRYLNEIELINKKVLKITFVVEVVFVVVCYCVALLLLKENIISYIQQLVIFVITFVFGLLNVICLIKGKDFVLVITFIELALFCLFNGIKSKATEISESDYKDVTTALADDDNYYYLKDYFDILDENNKSEYYRVYISYDDLYWAFSHDLSIIYNINGLMTYDSTYSQSFNKMKELNKEQIVEYIDWEFNIKDSNIMNFLSTKYSITSCEADIPFNNYEIVDGNFRGSLIIAKNNDYRPLGSTYIKSMSYEELKNNYNNDTSLLNEYVISDSDVSGLLGNSISNMYGIQYYDNYVCGSVDCDSNSFMVIGLPCEKGWKVTVNGEYVEIIECNGGMMGFAVNEGHNDIEMYFMPQGFKLGALCSGVGALAFVCLIIIDVRKSRKLS